MSTDNNAFVLWLTGLSGSGKSTLADIIFDRMAADGLKVEKLDGDVMRGFFPSTGFTKQARDEHIKRVGFMSSRLEKHGVIVIASFISPYKETRQFVRDLCENFVEVHVKASLEECEKRDVKGLYKRARAGEISDFTGINAPYEEPSNPEIVVDTANQTIEESLATILDYIENNFSEEPIGSS